MRTEWATEEWRDELLARRKRRTKYIDVVHDRSCSGCDGVFRCYSCRKLFGWCYGQTCIEEVLPTSVNDRPIDLSGPCSKQCANCMNMSTCPICSKVDE